MFIFNSDGTYSRKMSREDDIRMESENRGFYKGETHWKSLGKAEEQVEIAQNLIKKGMSAKDIAEATELPLNRIKSMMF